MHSFDLTLGRWIALGVVLCLGLTGCDQNPSQQSPGNAPPQTQAATPDPQDDAPADAQADTPAPAHLANPPADPRAAIQDALDDGLLESADTPRDKLAALLRVAGVPQASQVLVFSKTSLQHRRISPRSPRAIYFSDDCYIGYVPGGVIEYSDVDPDPERVTGFFSLDPDDTDHPQLTADRSCLSCHDGSRTNGDPGLLIRSVFPDPDGHLILTAGSTVVGHDTPLAQRWGGWYVTGNSGQTHHRGNQTTLAQANGDAFINNKLGSNVNDLSPYFRIDRYLQPTSDIVALMVLEHQVQMHNHLTQGAASVRKQIERGKLLAEHLGEPYDPATHDTLQRIIASRTDKIVRHLLFCDEVALTDPIQGSEAFQTAFRANRRPDAHGRSLKDFDLDNRLFKYRCSYMVYSRAFELMPAQLKDAVKAKLRAVLTGADDDPAYTHLGSKERHIILQILTDTGVL